MNTNISFLRGTICTDSELFNILPLKRVIMRMGFLRKEDKGTICCFIRFDTFLVPLFQTTTI